MDPMPGVRVTLITKDVHTPYRYSLQLQLCCKWLATNHVLKSTSFDACLSSAKHLTAYHTCHNPEALLTLCVCSGMLPGLVAGFYTFHECHIDLAQLCTFASARMINAEAVGIDKQVRQPCWCLTTTDRHYSA